MVNIAKNWQLQFAVLMMANMIISFLGWAALGILFPILWTGASFAFGAMWNIWHATTYPEDYGLARKDPNVDSN